jgi:hypothetical protein
VGVVNYLLPFGPGILAGFAAIIIYGGIGLVIIFGLCKLMRVPELAFIGDIAHKLTGRFKKS